MTKDIEREHSKYLAELLEHEVIKKDEFEDMLFKPEINAFHSNYLSARFMDNINFGWSAWQAAKAYEAKKLEGCVVVPAKSCKWTKDEDLNWWTECGEGFVFSEDPHPHNHNFKNCCFCGGLLEAARGGNE